MLAGSQVSDPLPTIEMAVGLLGNTNKPYTGFPE